MKKKAKKLVLAKETVRNMETRELGGVPGGLSAYDCTETVCCSGYNSCNCVTNPPGGTRRC